MKKPVKNSGVQQLIGAKSFGRNGLLTDGHGELCFYLVKPTNISVLSQESVTVKVRRFMQLLTAQPDMEICCIDDHECFDANKEYLKARMETEQNPKVRALLDRDLRFLDSIQLEMSTARQFMFIVRLRNGTDDASFSNLNRIEKVINEQGFGARKADKRDIKRILSIYFGAAVTADELPDTDGENAVSKWTLPD